MADKCFEVKGTIEDAKIAYRNGRYEEASLIFQKYASEQNAEALFFLGNMSADGLGFPLNADDAKKLLERSAQLGYLPASYRLRQLDNKNVHFYWKESNVSNNVGSNTLGVSKLDISSSNLAESKQQLQQRFDKLTDEDKVKLSKDLATQGDIFAMYEYGLYLINKPQPDYTNGAFYLGRAAQKGYSQAQYEFSKLYAKGLGVNKDSLQNILWLKRAQEQGNLDATYEIALIYCDENSGYYTPQLGVNLLENIKDQKPDVLVTLAKFYLNGHIVNKDPQKARFYLDDAIKLGVVKALVVLGNLLVSESNFMAGVPLLKEAASKNDIEAIFSLARLYDEGLGVARLEDKAAFLYDKAAEMGHKEAQYSFACICRRQNSPQGEKLARTWFYKSALQGYTKAIYEYGLILKKEIDAKFASTPETATQNQGDHKVSWFIGNETKPYYREYKEAFSYLITAAQSGISDAEFIVSSMYMKGEGIPADQALGLKWCKLAAEHGNFEAQFKMAQMYDNGDVFGGSLEQAVIWYSSASQNGSAQATYNLAMMYEDGRGVLQDNVKAFELFKKASDMGYVLATYQVGMHYLHGIGAKKNVRSAESYLGLASNQGLEEAIIELAKLYVNTHDISHKHVETAIKLLNREVQLGHGGGIYLLASLYLHGKGIAKDFAKGFELLKKAADIGHSNAQYDLGMLYFEGVSVARNYQLAVHYLSMAAMLNLDAANYMMGVCCRDGLGTLIDYSRAFAYFNKAAEKGYCDAYLALGKMYQDGTGGICNYQEAIHYYKLLAHCKYNEAYLLIANIYLSGNTQMHIDYEQAAYWLHLGANAHIPECCYKLGLLHINEKLKESNIERGIELIKEAANAGSGGALYHYAKLLIDGVYLPQNYVKAVSFLQKASVNNHVAATTLLARMYIEGKGCEAKPILAADLFTTAANHGDTEAQYELAKLFKDGFGVPQSNFDAYIWSVLAVSCSDSFIKARKLRDEVVLKLTIPQITQAQYIAADYFSHFSREFI